MSLPRRLATLPRTLVQRGTGALLRFGRANPHVRWLVPLWVWVGGALLLTLVPVHGAPTLTPLPALYESARLFLLDPRGHPAVVAEVGPVALWLVMFLAPAVTATTLLDLVIRHVLSAKARVATLHDHVIIAGLGEHGRALAEGLRGRWDVVGVDREPDAFGDGGVPSGRQQVAIEGDVCDAATLRAAGLRRARHVVFCTGDPLANVQAASVAAQELVSAGIGPDEAPRLHVLADERDLPAALAMALRRTVVLDFVDQFAASARDLLQTPPLAQALQAAPFEVRRIAIVGFGRFGAAVLRALVERARTGEYRLEVELIDRRAAARAALFAAHDGDLGTVAVTCAVDGDAEVWLAALGRRPVAERPHAVLLCVESDALNLRVAARIQAMAPGQPPQIAVGLRMVHGWAADAAALAGCHLVDNFVRAVCARLASDRPR